MGKAIDLCYGANLGCDEILGVVELLPRVFQLEKELMDWKCALPKDISLKPFEDVLPGWPDDHHCALERLAVVLTLRYLGVRILVHRPILVKLLDASSQPKAENQETALLQQIGPSSLEICIQSSMGVINLIQSIINSTDLRRNTLGSYWSSLYYSKKLEKKLFDKKNPSVLINHSLQCGFDTLRKLRCV